MAALTTIRSKGKLIAICVGGALLAFVLGDFINSGTTIFGASQTKVGEINGTSIDYMEFEANTKNRENFLEVIYNRSLDSDMSEDVRDYCWEQAIRRNTIGEYANKQGLVVTDDEIINLVNAGAVTPMIREYYTNPQVGFYDPRLVSECIKSGNARELYIWQNLENELRESRQYVKYLNMINAGMYITSADVEKEFADRTHLTDFKYVAVPYSDIKDEEVKVSDSDIKKVYEAKKLKLELAQELRDIAYVSFDIVPSIQDSTEALDIAKDIAAGLGEASVDEVGNYISSKSDIPYMEYFYGKDEIQDEDINNFVFSNEPGAVYGPYVDGQYYTSARIIEKQMRPDSVKISMIAVAYSGDTLAARNRVDSLMDVYNSGIDFGALALNNSDEQRSAQDSGNYGWVIERTSFIPELKSACFETKKGDTKIVKAPNAYFIIKVTDRTAPLEKVSVGFAAVEIRPGNQTRQEAWGKASEFAGTYRKPADFEKAVAEKGLVRRIAPALKSDTKQVPGISGSRQLVRWAFNDDESKEVSKVYEFGDRYIVAALTAVHPAGIPSVADVKEDLTNDAMKAAKAEIIAAKLNGVSSVEAAASAYGKTVQETRNVSFYQTQIPAIGDEPEVLAVAATLSQNQVSAPIKGKNAVYVIQATSVTPSQAIQPVNVDTDRKMMQMELRNRLSYQVPQAINKLAGVVDKRVKFF